MCTPGVYTSEPSSINMTSKKNTAANGAASSWPLKIRALRGNFIVVSCLAGFGHDVNNIRGSAFHIQHDRVYPADKVIVTRMCGNCQGQACCRANHGLPNSTRKLAHVCVQSL